MLLSLRLFVIAIAAASLACGSSERGEPPSDDSAVTSSSSGGDGFAGSGSSGSSGGTSAIAGSSGAQAAGAPNGGAPGELCGTSASEATFEADCLACAASDCERCLCSNCGEQLVACSNIEGCPEIAACIRESGCAGLDCYCGSFDAIACAGGQADGPCKAAILAAPGAREPTALEPSAGPASDAAVAIGLCAQPGQPCAKACSM